ncbi:hypothetical protein MH117_05180 [Paenibacillus sp. ACRRX]|uniref:hypothetical protein n=1 Tax=Paenibacillus sp. ACRRX TaxID=2918206 RepID=UPI001EF56F68|nr:hypothetical protein [Paenibacillus sp. ACRRX]MCG7406804.1 hypothetical protein [Paenibacillus sp. ACRRX]
MIRKSLVPNLKNRRLKKKKTVALRPNFDLKSTDNLGGGFRRLVFTDVQIEPNSFLEITINSGNRKVVSGGWSIANFQKAFAIESYPRQINQWVISVFNDTSVTRSITPYLITKA